MTESAESAASALDATAETGPAEQDPEPDARERMGELHRLQLADLEARELVDRMNVKVGKQEQHLDSAKASLAEAEEAAEAARAALDAHTDLPDEDSEESAE